MKALLVEDSVVSRFILEAALSKRGYEVTSCGDAETGWELFCQEDYPLILLDWMLPGMSGVELCRRIRSRPDGHYPLIVMITSRQGKNHLDMVLAAGVDDFVNKPVDTDLLSIRLEIAEDRVRQRQRQRRMQKTLDLAQLELQKSHDDLLSVLNQLDIGTVLIDGQGRIEYCNQRTCEFFPSSKTWSQQRLEWSQAFDLDAEYHEQMQAMIAMPADQRQRFTVQVNGARDQRYWVEVEVKDDPRQTEGKIVAFYDMSEVYRLRRQLGKKGRFGELVGKSTAMRQVYGRIRQLAGTDVTVLIQGETGTGKEVVARALVTNSKRRDGPFLALNCAGLTESLIGSQLFGYRRGAFTGAVDDRPGLLEEASGGTLLLDEIGDLPLEMQGNLLRVLQEGEVVRLGEVQPRKVDVRILAATNRDLQEAVRQGRFREDLLYRIRVASIHLPPLRHRVEDIPLLVNSFLAAAASRAQKPISEISPAAMRFMMEYDWPGNVRELQNCIDTSIITAVPPQILPADLPGHVNGQIPPPKTGVSTAAAPQTEQQRIVQALASTEGNRSLAAKLLGISRATLYRRMKRLGLADPS